MARGKPRAQHLGPEKRRPLVLDAALRLFVEHGYPGTSMDAIAEAAGVSKPVVYDCYESKEDLFRALLEREERRLLESVAAAMPSDLGDEGPEEMLRRAWTALFEAAAAAPDSWRVVVDSERVADPVVARRVRRSREATSGQLAAFLGPLLAERGIEDGERLAPLYAETLSAIAEAGVRVLLRSDDWEPAELAAVLARSAIRGPFAG
jgi:AcrR family transcriptional regulator